MPHREPALGMHRGPRPEKSFGSPARSQHKRAVTKKSNAWAWPAGLRRAPGPMASAARWVLALGCAVLLRYSSLAREGDAPPEFQVKAVFLSNFARFIEWPPGVLEPGSDVVIGVLGADPFGLYLDDVLRDQKVNGSALTVRRYESVEQIEQCHVLFVSGSEGVHAAEILARLRGRPILTVCDTRVFARHGAMVHLIMDDRRVRLRINLEAARREGLLISAKLLRTAEIAEPGELRP